MVIGSPQRTILLFSVLASTLLLPPRDALAQSLRPEARIAVEQMSQAAGAELSVTVSRRGLVRFLSTPPGAPIPLTRGGSAEQRARAFLARHGAAFGIGPGVEVSTLRVSPIDEVGMEHVRFRQSHRGIPITGGELSIHLLDQSVVAVNAETLADLRGVETVPAVTAPEAETLARDLLAQGLGVTDVELSEPRLELLDRELLGRRSSATRLTWFIEARRVDLREFLWIDAQLGKPALHFSQLTDALNREIYDADDPDDGVFGELGTLVRAEGDPPVSGDAGPDANAAYDYSGDTYDYFDLQHGRDSYDDLGSPLVSVVRFCPSAEQCPFANAFWTGSLMVYGEGFPAADDVAAHELTHGVTEHTANLYYYMQSGALNESYSDIFGETVDLMNGAGTDTASVRWLIGEDLPDIGAIRDMMDPTLGGDPGKTSDPEFVCAENHGNDNGGVHSNSGVPNHAYALMVDGGTYNGETVTGIGLIKAGKIQYRTLSQYLLSASDFLDNDKALRQSCQDLVGIAGITAGDCVEVGQALDAVEMSQTWPCTPTQAAVPAFCPAGQSPELWYYDDLESATGLSDCPADTFPSSWCFNNPSSALGSFATSGVRSLWGYDRPTSGNIGVQLVFGSMPPPSSRFQFNHSFGFDTFMGSFFDGGQVLTSTDGGATWQDAGGLITDGPGYGGTISSCCGNPLGGQSAFVGASWGFTASQLDLSSLSGSAFGLLFRIGTDSVIDDRGWFVDDFRIYTCATCLADRTLDAGYTGTASHYQASHSIVAGDGFTVEFDEDVTFEVGDFVVLESGFRVEGDFTVITGSGACP